MFPPALAAVIAAKNKEGVATAKTPEGIMHHGNPHAPNQKMRNQVMNNPMAACK